MMKNKELREKAAEIAKRLDVISLECRQENRGLTEDEQKTFAELKVEANRYLTEAEGFEALDSYEGEKLSRLKKSDISFNTHCNTREKANLDLACRSFLGRAGGYSNPEWDAHADMLGLNSRSVDLVMDAQKNGNRAAWASGTSGAGKDFIPTTLGDEIYRKVVSFGGLLNYLSSNGGIWNSDTGEPYNYPTFDATGLTGGLIGENSADSAETSLASGAKAFASYCFTSGIAAIPNRSIRDTKFPLLDVIASGLAEGLNRGISSYLLTGSGSAQPEGLLTNVVSGVTTASTSTFTYGEILSLMFSIDQHFMDKGAFLVSRGALQVLAGLVDTLGRPLFVPSLLAGIPSTLIGHPVYVDVSMPSVAATHTPIVFGDIAGGFKVRLIGNMNVRSTVDRYWELDQTALAANQYWDSRSLNTAAYACMTMHA